MRNRLRLAAVAIGLGLSVGCGAFRSNAESAGGDLAASLYFTNESLDEAAVYAVSGSQQIRIGTVMAGRTDTLSVPAGILGSAGTMRLIARPLGRNIVASSGPIVVHQGEELAVRLPSTLSLLIVLPPRS